MGVMMNIELVLNTLEKIVEQMQKVENIERIALYASFWSVASQFQKHVEMVFENDDHVQGCCRLHFAQLTDPLNRLAGLEKSDDPDLNAQFVRMEIQKLRGVTCLGKVLEDGL